MLRIYMRLAESVCLMVRFNFMCQVLRILCMCSRTKTTTLFDNFLSSLSVSNTHSYAHTFRDDAEASLLVFFGFIFYVLKYFNTLHSLKYLIFKIYIFLTMVVNGNQKPLTDNGHYTTLLKICFHHPCTKKHSPATDYRPVALTQVIMKCFKRLITQHMKSSLPPP